jgi:hypothetical protein
MSAQTSTERARPPATDDSGRASVDRVLGHPLAFFATAALLLALFGWTFVADSGRVAPTKDPAYYTWHTEMLTSDDPSSLLEAEGAYSMFAGGYRVSAPVIGGLMREIPGVSSLNSTVLLMVGVPVLTALLLAGFAYRHRRDPLIFHSVAIGVASLYLTPPFVGYLDNVLCLMWLAAAIWFIGPSRTSWRGRAGFFLFLLLAGFTHPTTLAIFCVTLGAIAIVRLIFRKFDLRSVIRDDAPMLLTAFAAGVVMVAAWVVGIWGKSASLTEAALPPPYDSDFFLERMGLWVDAMTPILNGPLFAIGVIGLLVAGWRWAEDDLIVVSVVWLAPLAGLFGFIGGLTYPYYRFFNTTLAWVLLVGVGAYFALRFFIGRVSRGGIGVLALLGVIAIVAIFANNFLKGFDVSGWNDPAKGWLSSTEHTDLDALRVALNSETDEDRPVVFVIDFDPESFSNQFQVWGDTKLAGNTSRYGLPPGQVDQAYLYLGSIDNAIGGRPTVIGGEVGATGEECDTELLGEQTYDCLSNGLQANIDEGTEGETPVYVVASTFNETGSNAELFSDQTGIAGIDQTEIWTVNDGVVLVNGEPSVELVEDGDQSGGILHLLRALLCLVLMLVPGYLALRYFFPDATVGEAVGMVPALSIGMLTLTGIVLLAIVRSPLDGVVPWLVVAIGVGTGALLRVAGSREPRPAAP